MLRTLIVEDEFTSRKILQAYLSPFGSCDIAVNGDEAIEAFAVALREGEPYRLVCLDINMPGKDGHQVCAAIRAFEEGSGVQGLDRAKVIMTSASSERGDIRSAFRVECDAYLIKPIDKGKLIQQMRELNLLDEFTF
jgi:two-component system chemotaxis response regulator CheY